MLHIRGSILPTFLYTRWNPAKTHDRCDMNQWVVWFYRRQTSLLVFRRANSTREGRPRYSCLRGAASTLSLSARVVFATIEHLNTCLFTSHIVYSCAHRSHTHSQCNMHTHWWEIPSQRKRAGNILCGIMNGNTDDESLSELSNSGRSRRRAVESHPDALGNGKCSVSDQQSSRPRAYHRKTITIEFNRPAVFAGRTVSIRSTAFAWLHQHWLQFVPEMVQAQSRARRSTALTAATNSSASLPQRRRPNNAGWWFVWSRHRQPQQRLTAKRWLIGRPWRHQHTGNAQSGVVVGQPVVVAVVVEQPWQCVQYGHQRFCVYSARGVCPIRSCLSGMTLIIMISHIDLFLTSSANIIY